MENEIEQFRVTFHYTIEIQAWTYDQAEELAAAELAKNIDEVEFRRYFIYNMAATVEKIEE
jgi:hypothetical protein